MQLNKIEPACVHANETDLLVSEAISWQLNEIVDYNLCTTLKNFMHVCVKSLT